LSGGCWTYHCQVRSCRVAVSIYSSFQWSGGSVATNLMIPSSANTCESINSSSLLLVVRLLLTLLQHPPKMRPTMLTGRTIAAIARGEVSVLATRFVWARTTPVRQDVK
jgi:hypothetical protein